MSFCYTPLVHYQVKGRSMKLWLLRILATFLLLQVAIDDSKRRQVGFFNTSVGILSLLLLAFISLLVYVWFVLWKHNKLQQRAGVPRSNLRETQVIIYGWMQTPIQFAVRSLHEQIVLLEDSYEKG